MAPPDPAIPTNILDQGKHSNEKQIFDRLHKPAEEGSNAPLKAVMTENVSQINLSGNANDV